MVTHQPHHGHTYEPEGTDADAENRTSPEGLCGDVAAYVLGVLDPAQHVIFSRHLAGCEGCRLDAADFGMFAPVLRQGAVRQSLAPPAGHQPYRLTRGLLMVAAGFVVALVAVLGVVQSWSTSVDDPVEVGSLLRAESTPSDLHSEMFPLLRWV